MHPDVGYQQPSARKRGKKLGQRHKKQNQKKKPFLRTGTLPVGTDGQVAQQRENDAAGMRHRGPGAGQVREELRACETMV